MHKSIVILALGILLEASCGAPPVTEVPLPATERSPVEQAPSATSLPSPTGTASPTATAEPILVAAAEIRPEAFSQPELLHNYWPVISEAAGMSAQNVLGKSLTAWALSSDGRYLAAAGCNAEAGVGTQNGAIVTSCEKTIHDSVSQAYLYILDTATESILASLPETGQVTTVTQMAFSPDGNQLIYGLSSGRVAIWDVPSGEIQAVLSEGSPAALTFGVSPDGKWIAVASEHTTHIWDITEGSYVHELPNGRGEYNGVPQFSADGKKLLIADFPFLVIYDTSTWQELSVQIGMPDGLENDYAVSPDLSLVATCDISYEDPQRPMRIWEVATGALLQTMKDSWPRCGRIGFSPSGNLLLRFDERGLGPLVWETAGWGFFKETSANVVFVHEHDKYVKRVQVSQDGRSVLVETDIRLSLFGLPAPEAAGTWTPQAPAAAASPDTAPTQVPTTAVRAQACEITVTGALQLQVHPCTPPSRSFGGSVVADGQYINFVEGGAVGVRIQLPVHLIDKLEPGTYNVGAGDDGTRGGQIVAYFFQPDPNNLDPYADPYFYSYNGGTLILTEAGPDVDYISGSFSFGAHRLDTGRQINVEGTFENIPFSHVNGP
jgi:WD40 repeat protein